MKRTLTVCLWLTGLFLFLLGSTRLCLYGAQSRQNARVTGEIRQALAPQTAVKTEPGTPYDRYRQFFDQNGDMVGWLRIDGTVIDYPVMRTPLEPNFYLKRNFNKERSGHGCLYVAEACTLTPRSDNIIIHGHNMRDGQMFGSLGNYRSETYYREHPVIHFDTRSSYDAYRIIAVFRTVPSEFPFYQFTGAETPAEFEDFVAFCQKLSFYDTGQNARYGDKLLTLSTCEYSRPNSRLVVVAKKLDD